MFVALRITPRALHMLGRQLHPHALYVQQTFYNLKLLLLLFLMTFGRISVGGIIVVLNLDLRFSSRFVCSLSYLQDRKVKASLALCLLRHDLAVELRLFLS